MITIIILLSVIIVLLVFGIFQQFKLNDRSNEYKADMMIIKVLDSIQDIEGNQILVENLKKKLKTNEGTVAFNVILKERGYIKYS